MAEQTPSVFPASQSPALMTDEDYTDYLIDALHHDGIWRKLVDRLDDPASHLPLLALTALYAQHDNDDLKRLVIGLTAFGAPPLPIPAPSAPATSSLTG